MDLFYLVMLICLCAIAFMTSFVWIVFGGRADLGAQIKHTDPTPAQAQSRDELMLLFEDNELVDANQSAQRELATATRNMDWFQVFAQLKPQFKDLPASLEEVRDSLSLRNQSRDRTLTIERVGHRTRLKLTPGQRDAEELDGLPTQIGRSVIDLAPYPIWHSSTSGEVIWYNHAYEALMEKIGQHDLISEPSFQDIHGVEFSGTGQRRLAVQSPDGTGERLWFDVVAVPLNQGRVCYASDVNAVVDAEIAQRNFVQTLAKTFAQLPIGLAIFDRNRQLALFNPALIDLMSLPAHFLSSRPDLTTFFDKLRDSKMMPEPKNYSDWREQIAELARAAADGRYSETWTLPSGSVYSVSGRPHPDGAVAFLFEDITAEITLTRGFRAELEMSVSVLDRIEEGIALFSADSRLLLTNAAYRTLMGDPDPENDRQMTVIEATQSWQNLCKPTPCWGEIRDFVYGREARSDWWSNIELKSGKSLQCHVQPVANGATLIRFCP